MDANDTRYHLLLGRQDWGACVLDEDGTHSLAESWRPENSSAAVLDWHYQLNELTLHSRVFRFAAAPRALPPAIDDRRGAGRDGHGNWYWIGPGRQEVLVNSSGSGRTTRFWSTADEIDCPPRARYGEFGPVGQAEPARPLDLQGLAVTVDQYLVVGVRQPAGLLVFDLFQGGPPRQIVFPSSIEFAPFDMAPRPHGGVWVLDRANRRYWAFDAGMNVVPREQELIVLEPAQLEDFQPLVADPGDPDAVRRRASRVMPRGIAIDDASPLDLEDPIAIESMPDDSVLILDAAPTATSSQIVHMRFSARLGPPLDTEVMAAYLEPGAISDRLLRGHDLAFVRTSAAATSTDDTGRLLGQLYVASGEGNQAFAFNLLERSGSLVLDPIPRYLPMRLFGGKAIVASETTVYYDFDDRWLPLVEQPRARHGEHATLFTPIAPRGCAFDGREPDCTWHRLLIDACLPPGSDVLVESRTANDRQRLHFAAWHAEPPLRIRSDGTELPYVHRQGPYDTFELLFQRARGRYLQLKLTLVGNGQTTPHIRALRAYYPRFSYLTNYLPAVYREDEVSASFMDRFLANFEGIFTAIEDRIADAQTLFDPRTAPAETLDWLATWFAVSLDPAWDEPRRRLFIRYALLFFRQRGTLNGVYMALQVALGDCIDERLFTTPLAQRGTITAIRIVEQFRTRRTPGVVLGDPTDLAGLRVVSRVARWTPAEGVGQLKQRYDEFAAAQPTGMTLATAFDVTPPTTADALAVWTQFSRDVLGFVPSTDATNQERWAAFLGRRHVSIDRLNNQYRRTGPARYVSFAAVPQPVNLPSDGPALQDGYQFQAVVLPLHRAAHRFVVLLPMPRSGFADDADRNDRLALANRVVELEKPSHTTFDVRFYWAMFRVGEARLGLDTLVERGSRSPELMRPMILGQGHLVESYLATTNVAPPCRSYVAGDQR